MADKKSIKIDTLTNLGSQKELLALLETHDAKKLIRNIKYEEELRFLQSELLKLQQWVITKGKRVVIIFEGRDAAGKGGTIRRFIEHLNPREMSVVALPKPTETEMGQWYFQRYIAQLPNNGKIVFFDRSWYNRAVVEPVNGFCTKEQHKKFLRQVNVFEHLLYEEGVILIKFWFSISKEEQLKRFNSRKENSLKQWKISPVDMKAQDLWKTYTKYKEKMFSLTHTSYSPWITIQANSKKNARLNAIKHVLSQIDYDNKTDEILKITANPEIVSRYYTKD